MEVGSKLHQITNGGGLCIILRVGGLLIKEVGPT